jgi:hypothetical protein
MVSETLYEAIRHEYDIVREELELPYQRIGWTTAAAAVLATLIATGIRDDLLDRVWVRIDVFLHFAVAAACCVAASASMIYAVRAVWPGNWNHASGMSQWIESESKQRERLTAAGSPDCIEQQVRADLCATYAQVVDRNRPRIKERSRLTSVAVRWNGVAVILGIAFLLTIVVLRVTVPRQETVGRKDLSMRTDDSTSFNQFTANWGREDPKPDTTSPVQPGQPYSTDDDDRADGGRPSTR